MLVNANGIYYAHVCVCVCACVCEWGFRVSMRLVCQCVPRAGSTGSKGFHWQCQLPMSTPICINIICVCVFVCVCVSARVCVCMFMYVHHIIICLEEEGIKRWSAWWSSLRGWEKAIVNQTIDWLIDDHLYSAILRSALEQTHCARLWFYMSDRLFIARFFEYPPKWCTYSAGMAGATWNCSHLGASSVYTIQPCTMSLHAKPHT